MTGVHFQLTTGIAVFLCLGKGSEGVEEQRRRAGAACSSEAGQAVIQSGIAQLQLSLIRSRRRKRRRKRRRNDELSHAEDAVVMFCTDMRSGHVRLCDLWRCPLHPPNEKP